MKKIHEGKALKIYLFINEIDYGTFATQIGVSRTWLYDIFNTEIQTEKTWDSIEKFTNVNKQEVISLYFRAFHNGKSLQMYSVASLTEKEVKNLVNKHGIITLY